MDESEVILLIKGLMPDLSTTQISLLKKKLEDLGVGSVQSLQFVQAEDISDIVKLIPARRLLAEARRQITGSGIDDGNSSNTSIESTYHTDHSSSTILLNSPCSSSHRSSSSDDQGMPPSFWAQSFKIPWEKFPKLFLDECEENKRPTEYLRRETIRILVHSIRDVCKKPNSKDVHIIASRFVSRYEQSLGDNIMGKVIGNGYSSVMSCIMDRLNNLNRKSSDSSTGNEIETNKLCTKTYGCLDTWSVAIDSEEEELLNKKKEWMKSEFQRSKNFTCQGTVVQYMNETYPLQRKIINSGVTTDILKEFPYILQKEVLCQHFETLTGHSLLSYVNNEKRKFSIIHNLRKENSATLRKEISIMDSQVKEVNPHIKLAAFIQLLLTYFKEDGLLEFHQPCTDVKQVESIRRKDGAPVIAVIGDLYSPLFFHIVLENKVITTLDTIDEAVMVVFGVYYIFNLEYHPKATQTLEFIQRALIGINPDKGTKKPKKNSKKDVSSKVIHLASQIDDF